MSNWNILVKVCDKMTRKERRKNKSIKCEYMVRGRTTKYITYLHNAFDYNSRDYNIENKLVYWIKE